MIWYVCFGFFAAVGVLFLLWLLRGLVLPECGQTVLAVWCEPGGEKSLLRRCQWLRELGLIRCSVVMIGSRLPLEEQLELMSHYGWVLFQSPAQWIQDIEERLGNHDGAGTGDPTGHHCSGGVSKL